MSKKLISIVLLLAFLTVPAILAYAHCEIPCGIYDDRMRIEMIKEHIKTIEKSMKEIERLSIGPDKDYNQITRWIINKEEHAGEVQHIASQYFMTQRIKPVEAGETVKYEKYLNELKAMHRLVVLAMKAKQSIDTGIVEKMNDTVEEFSQVYFEIN